MLFSPFPSTDHTSFFAPGGGSACVMESIKPTMYRCYRGKLPTLGGGKDGERVSCDRRKPLPGEGQSHLKAIVLCQAVPDRESGSGGSIVGDGLVENAGQVVDHGLFTQDEFFGNLAVAFACGNETQHFDLPRT